MELVERLAWLGLAAIHVLPALGAVMPGGLARLYGQKPGGGLVLLLEHRSVLFAAIVALCLWSAADPQPRPAALLVTGLSVSGYLLLYLWRGRPRGALRRVALVDLLALPLLALAAARLLAD